MVLCFLAAVIGDSVGYTFGKRVGRQLFQKEDSLLFHKKYLVQAEAFYEKHGGKTIVLARFIPFVRTFAPIVAGMGQMNYSRFLAYNALGGAIWAIGVTSAGYFLGNLIPDVDKYLLPIAHCDYCGFSRSLIHPCDARCGITQWHYSVGQESFQSQSRHKPQQSRIKAIRGVILSETPRFSPHFDSIIYSTRTERGLPHEIEI